MEKTALIGSLHFKKNDMIGSVVRSRTVYYGLIELLGADLVSYVDIWGGPKRIPIVFIQLFFTFMRCRNIVLVSSQTVGPYIAYLKVLKTLFGNNFIYVTTGSRFPERIKQSKDCLSRFRFVSVFLVESSTCVSELRSLGFSNVELFRNFLQIDIDNLPQRKTRNDCKDIKLCFFSRVTPEKGIFDAISVFKRALSVLADYKLSLYIYGVIEPSIKKEFYASIENCPSIKYMGCVKSEVAAATLTNYDILLFPTRFPGEGIPGTLIHAFASGILIISSKWKLFDEMMTSGYNALSFEHKNTEAFFETLLYAIRNLQELSCIGQNARKEYNKFDIKYNLPVLEKYLI